MLYVLTRESVQPIKLKHVAMQHVGGKVSCVPSSFYTWVPGWFETEVGASASREHGFVSCDNTVLHQAGDQEARGAFPDLPVCLSNTQHHICSTRQGCPARCWAVLGVGLLSGSGDACGRLWTPSDWRGSETETCLWKTLQVSGKHKVGRRTPGFQFLLRP